VMAALSYRFLEEPMIRKGRMLARKLIESRARAAASGMSTGQ